MTTWLDLPSLTTLQGDVYRNLAEDVNDTANPVFPLTDVTYFLNHGMYDVLRRLDHDWFKKSASVTAPSGTESSPSLVTLPTDALAHLQVVFVQNSTTQSMIPEREEQWLDEHRPGWRASTAAAPTDCFIRIASDGTMKLQLVPNLTTSITNGIFYRYTVRPTAMSSGADTPLVFSFAPDLARPTLAAYATYMLAPRMGSEESAKLADMYMRVYEQQLGKITAAIKSYSRKISTARYA